MAPRTFNGAPDAQIHRLPAYRGDYVTLIPTQAVKGIELPQGGEIHYEDGSRAVAMPGDWAIEGTDGRLRVVTAKVIAANYEAAKGDPDGRAALAGAKARATPGVPDQPVTARVRFAGEPAPTPASGSPDQIPAFKEGAPTVDAAGTDQLREQAAARNDNDGKIKPEEKAQLQQQLRDQAQQAQEKIIRLATAAFEQGLIDQHEQHGWVNTGEPPAHLEIAYDEQTGDFLIERKPQTAVETEEQIQAREDAEREQREIAALAAAQEAEEAQQQ